MALGRFIIDTRPLRIPAYRRLWLSTIITSVGVQLTTVAVPMQIYAVTSSSAYVGLAGLVALAPLVVFALWGGAIADAVDRRKLLLLTNAGAAATAILFWAQAATGLNELWVLYVLLGVQQAFAGANLPARQAAIPRLVPLDLLPAANALGSTVFQLGAVCGPMLAGLLIPVLGIPSLYLIDALSLTAVMWAVWRLPPLPPGDDAPKRAGLRHVIAGFGYLATKRILLVSFLADIVAMVFGMPRALYPQLSQEVYGDPPGGGFALGVLYAAMQAGGIICGLFFGVFSRIKRYGAAIVVSICVWGLAIVGLGLSTHLWLAAGFLMLGGAADFISMVFRNTMLQEAATDQMRGRMQGSFTVVVVGGPRMADLLHGGAGAAVGTTLAISGGGVAVLIGMLVLALAVPAFWHYRAQSDGE